MKAIFSNLSAPLDGLKNKTLGTASSNPISGGLDDKTVMVIQLTCHIFGSLDRKSISSLETKLDLSSHQRSRVPGKISEIMQQNQSLAEILKPMKRIKQGRHNYAYDVFGRLCHIAVHSQRYDMSVIKKVVNVGKRLGLSKDEILKVIEKSELAV